MTERDRRSGLIVVDMQNLFVDAVGEAGPTVLAAVNAHVADAGSRSSPVFYTRDVAPTELPAGDPERVTQLHPDLDVRGPVVTKGPGKNGRFSGFLLDGEPGSREPVGAGPGDGGLSALGGLLHQARVDTVVVVGIATDVCVAATARDARRLGYHVTVPLHATAFVHAHPAGDRAAVADLRQAGIAVAGQLP